MPRIGYKQALSLFMSVLVSPRFSDGSLNVRLSYTHVIPFSTGDTHDRAVWIRSRKQTASENPFSSMHKMCSLIRKPNCILRAALCLRCTGGMVQRSTSLEFLQFWTAPSPAVLTLHERRCHLSDAVHIQPYTEV